MSTANQDWNWIFDIWLRKRPPVVPLAQGEKKPPRWSTTWRVCPSATGEPWVSYALGAFILELSVDAIRKKVQKLDSQYRHGSVSCLFKLTALETINQEDSEDGEEA